MYDRPKGNYSFLIALAKQLATAVESHRDDDVGYACESLHASLALLDAICGEGAGDDAGGDAEGVDADDAPGDDTPLGAALARIAELEGNASRLDVTVAKRRLAGAADQAAAGSVGKRSKRRGTSVLTRGRRGKK